MQNLVCLGARISPGPGAEDLMGSPTLMATNLKPGEREPKGRLWRRWTLSDARMGTAAQPAGLGNAVPQDGHASLCILRAAQKASWNVSLAPPGSAAGAASVVPRTPCSDGHREVLPPRGWWGRTSTVNILHPTSPLSSGPGQELRKLGFMRDANRASI